MIQSVLNPKINGLQELERNAFDVRSSQHLKLGRKERGVGAWSTNNWYIVVDVIVSLIGKIIHNGKLQNCVIRAQHQLTTLLRSQYNNMNCRKQ